MISISYKYKQGALCLDKNITQKYNLYMVLVYHSKFCDLSLCFIPTASVSTTFLFFQFLATYIRPSPSTLTAFQATNHTTITTSSRPSYPQEITVASHLKGALWPIFRPSPPRASSSQVLPRPTGFRSGLGVWFRCTIPRSGLDIVWFCCLFFMPFLIHGFYCGDFSSPRRSFRRWSYYWCLFFQLTINPVVTLFPQVNHKWFLLFL